MPFIIKQCHCVFRWITKFCVVYYESQWYPPNVHNNNFYQIYSETLKFPTFIIYWPALVLIKVWFLLDKLICMGNYQYHQCLGTTPREARWSWPHKIHQSLDQSPGTSVVGYQAQGIALTSLLPSKRELHLKSAYSKIDGWILNGTMLMSAIQSKNAVSANI